MQTKATIIADSIHEGARITTMHLRYPRFILAELNTHGLLARSTRSTRAVPTKKLIREVWSTPFVPSVGSTIEEALTRSARRGAALLAERRKDIDAEIVEAIAKAKEQT